MIQYILFKLWLSRCRKRITKYKRINQHVINDIQELINYYKDLQIKEHNMKIYFDKIEALKFILRQFNTAWNLIRGKIEYEDKPYKVDLLINDCWYLKKNISKNFNWRGKKRKCPEKIV